MFSLHNAVSEKTTGGVKQGKAIVIKRSKPISNMAFLLSCISIVLSESAHNHSVLGIFTNAHNLRTRNRISREDVLGGVHDIDIDESVVDSVIACSNRGFVGPHICAESSTPLPRLPHVTFPFPSVLSLSSFMFPCFVARSSRTDSSWPSIYFETMASASHEMAGQTYEETYEERVARLNQTAGIVVLDDDAVWSCGPLRFANAIQDVERILKQTRCTARADANLEVNTANYDPNLIADALRVFGVRPDMPASMLPSRSNVNNFVRRARAKLHPDKFKGNDEVYGKVNRYLEALQGMYRNIDKKKRDANKSMDEVVDEMREKWSQCVAHRHVQWDALVEEFSVMSHPAAITDVFEKNLRDKKAIRAKAYRTYDTLRPKSGWEFQVACEWDKWERRYGDRYNQYEIYQYMSDWYDDPQNIKNRFWWEKYADQVNDACSELQREAERQIMESEEDIEYIMERRRRHMLYADISADMRKKQLDAPDYFAREEDIGYSHDLARVDQSYLAEPNKKLTPMKRMLYKELMSAGGANRSVHGQDILVLQSANAEAQINLRHFFDIEICKNNE